jgi:hypothetical protein
MAAGGPAPSVRTDRGCYEIHQTVTVSGSHFAPSRIYDIAINGVDFGQNATGPTGSFTTSLQPGGLPRNIVQAVELLDATDGTSDATTTFTLTRPPGALFLSAGGDPRTQRGSFKAWGVSPSGHRVGVYVHYVAPTHAVVRTVALGRTVGQCGSLRTGIVQLFPFRPGAGNWTLQLDTSRVYSPRPAVPVARIGIRVP